MNKELEAFLVEEQKLVRLLMLLKQPIVLAQVEEVSPGTIPLL
jgi:hypothetical protein